MHTLTADDVINMYQLEPLEFEGGYFRRTYLSDDTIRAKHLPKRYQPYESKSLYSVIYYLHTPDTISRVHRLPSDEIYHFCLGDPVALYLYHDNGQTQTITLGQDIHAGHLTQFTVPFGAWQGSMLMPGGQFALLGVTVVPAFDFADFELPKDFDAFMENYDPGHHDIIRSLR